MSIYLENREASKEPKPSEESGSPAVRGAAAKNPLRVATLLTRIERALSRGERARCRLPGGGTMHVDQVLPFVCVYRQPTERPDAGTQKLVLGQASYLCSRAPLATQPDVVALAQGVLALLAELFGGALLLEVWSSPDQGAEAAAPPADFALHFQPQHRQDATIEALTRALLAMDPKARRPRVELVEEATVAPPGLPALLPSGGNGQRVLGLEIGPSWRDSQTGELYPLVLRRLQRRLSSALARALFAFTLAHTSSRPSHYQALGRRAFRQSTWKVDAALSDVSGEFEFLLLCTPTNVGQAWAEFQRSRFEREPTLLYRQLSIDPFLHKRRLYDIPVEKVEDPTMAWLFAQKLDELDRQITMLEDRDTPRFVLGSRQLYGSVEDELLADARRLLEAFPPAAQDHDEGFIDAEGFAEAARHELEEYRRMLPDLRTGVEVRKDMSGLLVSDGKLLVDRSIRVPRERLEALLQHEVGTHLLTWANAGVQPFRLLRAGLQGYGELQEGLAVLAEHLVGGLNRRRLRLLAGRVVAAHAVEQGASFVDIYRQLERDYGFTQYISWYITLRVKRAGGLTKDASYLRGLVRIMAHLRAGGLVRPLVVGKISIDHIPVVQELMRRGVVVPPPLKPRFLERPEQLERLERIRAGANLCQLACD